MIKSKIFAFIFLAGMIFTVFNYLPLIEEESPHKKIELAKKSGAEDSNDGADEEQETNGGEFLFDKEITCIHNLPVKDHAYFQSLKIFPHFTADISTPPPRF